VFEGPSLFHGALLHCDVCRELILSLVIEYIPQKLSDNLGGSEVGTFVKGMNMQMRTIVLCEKV
jgi:hypothetical protein